MPAPLLLLVVLPLLFVAFLVFGLWLLTREPRPVRKWKLNSFPPLSKGDRMK